MHGGRDLRVLAVPAEAEAEGFVSLSVDHAAGQVMVTRAEGSSTKMLQSLAAGTAGYALKLRSGTLR